MRLLSNEDPEGPDGSAAAVRLHEFALRQGALRRVSDLSAATADLLRALETAGIKVILLKGPVTAAWLYATEAIPRAYADVDLLLAPEDHPAAAEVLGGLGYRMVEPLPKDPELARLVHSQGWVGPAQLDLHWRVPGVGASPEAAWAIWTARHADRMTVGGAEVAILDEIARALQLALHVAQRGGGEARSLADLERGLGFVADDVWDAVARLAVEVDATSALTAGLRSSAAGAAVADRLGLPDVSIRERLRARDAGKVPRGPDRLLRLREAPEPKARLAIARAGVWPSREALTQTYPVARRGARGRAAARAGHLVVGPVHVVRGVALLAREWLGSRRAGDRA